MLGGILAKMGPQDTTPVSKYVIINVAEKNLLAKLIFYCR